LFDGQTQDSVLRFLSVSRPPAPLQAATVKRNSSDLRDVISNFANVERRLAGTELQAMLQDVRL
jgi:hypothetical protein